MKMFPRKEMKLRRKGLKQVPKKNKVCIVLMSAGENCEDVPKKGDETKEEGIEAGT